MTRREAREAEQRRAALQEQEQEREKEAVRSSATPPHAHYPTEQRMAQEAAERQQASHTQSDDRRTPQWPAEQQAAPQWLAGQQGVPPDQTAHEAPFQWQLDAPDSQPQQHEEDIRLPWSEEPQPWSGDPDDDESFSHRLSRAERRALKHGGYHDDEKPRRKGPWGCLVGLLVVAALVVGAFFVLRGPINMLIERFTPAEDYTGAGTGEVVFMIHDGDTGADIAENLVDEGVTASYDAFYDLLLEQTPDPEFHPGAYQLAEKMSAQSALDALLDPTKKLENTFVIQEGMWASNALAEAATVSEIPIEELQAAAADLPALGLPPEATSVEGFLFPATYTVAPGMTASDLVKMLVDRSFQALDAAGVAPEDRWRTVVKASLIEREAGLRDDYYKVSRVIENRLNPELFESGLLQFDSTVHYGIGDDSVVTTTDAQRADPGNPYNTYVHPGLPPGPIGNPGDLAIDAAIHPAAGPWLYFVTVDLDSGETVFSSTIEEHEAAVVRFRAWLDEHPEYGN
ncbi:endolytic transglycosylase MltG [Agromyces sp. ISL-38]|uniref:endolytic transglycosylase MltG n=1 Tax=Agromyces sp. ISL-38 TaxID=2819107 RepID=UPI001BE83F85|nr:endolytic transglycosylase MltG [Agromyces sp. ISL-38]MBT2499871.1 endolytic transglycosylase MltG [Agromyces sp. ISL-38]